MEISCMFEAWERKRVCVVSHAVEVLSIDSIIFGSDDEYVVSQAASLVSINDERMSSLCSSSWSFPTIEL